MVGIPGRSKGCNTCRQRRVKCTEEKPICNRCVRGGFACQGYTRETVWHHLTTDSASTNSSTQAILGRLEVVGSRKPESRTGAKVPPMPTQISLSAFQEDLCFAYIFSNFVWRGYGASWLHQSSQGLLGQLAFDSVKALAEISFGKSQKSYQTEIQGRLKYGKALRYMIERLGDGERSSLRELVIPILLLLMHTTTLTDRSAAMFHLQAMTRILSACGPRMFQHQPLRDAFEAARATMVVASLVMRKRVFLDTPAWHKGPYALEPSSKAPQSYLLDILASVPGLLEDYHKVEEMMQEDPSHASFAHNIDVSTTGTHPSCDAMPKVAETDFEDIASLRSNIVNRVILKLESLFMWRLQWQVAFGADVYAESDIQNSSAESLNDSTVNCLDKLQFSRPGAAADIALYNAVLMWLLALINELEPLKAHFIVESCAYQAMMSMPDADITFTSASATWLGGSPSFEPLRGVGATTRVRDAALEICRVFEWQSANHASVTGETNFVYMFPIGLALCVFDMEPENRDWIRVMLDANALTRDYGVGYARDDGSVHHKSNVDHPSLIGNAEVGMMDVETGMLHQLQGFGWYVTRELADDKHSQEIPDPNLVHLLLLRGRS
ncbi:hypothetical protein F4803DRAFT_560573 [Xylaria telfairii]|nr:hypothetical protein F4803DRAFT_560573 [Xylaria telfairii]